MESVTKKIITIIAVIYLVINLLFSFTLKGIYSEELNERVNRVQIYQKYVEDLSLLNNEYNYINSIIQKLYIVNANLIILSIIAVIGIIIGLIVSQKENSKIKYITYFIVGNITFNICWTIIYLIIMSAITKPGIYIGAYTPIISTIIEYLKTTLKTFLPYTAMYILILYVHISNNKLKVKELNETLKNERNEVKKENKNLKKKIFIIIMVLITLIITVLTSIIVRKTIIINRYKNAINEVENTQNYYLKIEVTEQDEKGNPLNTNYENSINEYFYKEGKYIYKRSNNKETTYVKYVDKAKVISLSNDAKATINNKNIYDLYIINNDLNFFSVEKYLGTWKSIVLAFKVNITKEIYDGVECYKIKHSDYGDLYIDCETYMPVACIRISKTVKPEQIRYFKEKYTMNINTITDEDVKEPDLTRYEIIDNRTLKEVNQ